jgi:hypothetical protein
MDKKKLLRSTEPEDLKGFEEFIEAQQDDHSFLPRGVGGGARKSEAGFEHFTFLENDAHRLGKLKALLNEGLPFSSKFDQSQKLVTQQREEIEILKKKIFELQDRPESDYRRSLGELFDAYFGPTL